MPDTHPTWDDLRAEQERRDAMSQLEKTGKPLEVMHARLGVTSGAHCGDCVHLVKNNHHGQIYYKCGRYGLSHGKATDWRLHWQACGLFEQQIGERKAVYTE